MSNAHSASCSIFVKGCAKILAEKQMRPKGQYDPSIERPIDCLWVVAAGSSRKPRAKATSKDVTIQVDDEESFGEEDYEASNSGESG